MWRRPWLLNIDSSFVNITDYYGCTPLWYAAGFGNADIVKLLLARGADVNVQNINGRRPLHCCSWNTTDSAPQIMEALLSSDAEVNVTDETGNTPLHLAVHEQSYACALLLLDHGADANVRNKYDERVLDRLCPALSPNHEDYASHQELSRRLTNQTQDIGQQLGTSELEYARDCSQQQNAKQECAQQQSAPCQSSVEQTQWWTCRIL